LSFQKGNEAMLKSILFVLLSMMFLVGCTVEVNSYYTPPVGYLTDQRIYETVVSENGHLVFLTRREIVAGDREPFVERRLGGRYWRCYSPAWRSIRYVWCTTEHRLDAMLQSVHAGYEYEDTFWLLPYGSYGTYTPIYLVR